MRLLILYGASPNATANNGQTPLHLAALAGNNEPIGFLIRRGAKVLVHVKGYVVFISKSPELMSLFRWMLATTRAERLFGLLLKMATPKSFGTCSLKEQMSNFQVSEPDPVQFLSLPEWVQNSSQGIWMCLNREMTSFRKGIWMWWSCCQLLDRIRTKLPTWIVKLLCSLPALLEIMTLSNFSLGKEDKSGLKQTRTTYGVKTGYLDSKCI